MNSFQKKVSNPKGPRVLIAAAVALGVLSLRVHAAQITWTGAADGATTANWQNPTNNWSGAIPVNSANLAVFTDTGLYNSTTAATIDANGSFSIGEIQFATSSSGTAPPISINNSLNGIITLTGPVGVLVQAKQTNPVTFGTNLALGNAAPGSSTTFNITQGTTVAGVISDGTGVSGSLLKLGSAALALKGVNTYTGTTTVQQNNLQIGADAPSGSAGALGNSTTPVQLGNASTGATQNFGIVTTGKFTVGRDIAVYAVPSGTGVATIGGSASQLGTSTFSGQITLGESATLQSSTTGSGVVDFTGQITGAGGLTKAGAGAVSLDNSANNYLGKTLVSAGTLLINGAVTGGGSVSVTAGTLGGIGSISTGTALNGLNVANGSVLAPGLVAGGTANAGTALTIAGDTTIDGALSIQADSNTSKLATSGALTLNNDSSLIFTGSSNLTAPVYVIASYGSLGGSGAFGTISNEPAGYVLNYSYQGNEIALVASPTPEPAALALLGIGSLAIVARKRRS